MWDSCECLNRTPKSSVANILKQGLRDQAELLLESDADEELLLTIVFRSQVRPASFAQSRTTCTRVPANYSANAAAGEVAFAPVRRARRRPRTKVGEALRQPRQPRLRRRQGRDGGPRVHLRGCELVRAAARGERCPASRMCASLSGRLSGDSRPMRPSAAPLCRAPPLIPRAARPRLREVPETAEARHLRREQPGRRGAPRPPQPPLYEPPPTSAAIASPPGPAARSSLATELPLAVAQDSSAISTLQLWGAADASTNSAPPILATLVERVPSSHRN